MACLTFLIIDWLMYVAACFYADPVHSPIPEVVSRRKYLNFSLDSNPLWASHSIQLQQMQECFVWF